ncbi:MAG: Rv1355c family protein [Bacteroidia bacterium]|nr:Rv1355c family protein [Bacteroidia bacterium]
MNSYTKRLNDLKISQAKSDIAFKPLFYRLNNGAELAEFQKVLEIPSITITDQITDQISEYVKIKNPDRKFSSDELEKEVKKHIGETPLDVYGVWVYYPWSRRLVHILDEQEFIDVRTSRNQYKITPKERDILSKKKIGVIGLSVGQSVSVTLAMERICGELRLADFDKLELTNLNRIRTGVHNLGLEKVYSVAREISEIDPYINVVCFPEGLTEKNMDDFFTKNGKLDLLVEESDGFDIKILCRYKARELKVPVIMEASDRCMVDVERFDLEPTRSILHGIVDHLDIPTLKSLKTNEEKIPYMLDVLGLETTTPRLKASMIEMQQTITTWPQLASAVTMGGGITADVSRRMLLNQFTQSGRYYVDIDELIGNKTNPADSTASSETPGKKALVDHAYMTSAAQSVKTPASELNAEHAKQIVEAAITAPSNGNIQPWKWLFSKESLFLFKDSTDPDFFTDPKQINTFLSLGAALENVAIKASELGYELNSNLLPPGNMENLIAACTFKINKSVSKDPLAPFILKRHTNRKAGSGKPIAETVLKQLTETVKDNKNISISFISEQGKVEKIGQMVGICERIRLLHPQGHHDYFTKELKWAKKGELITEGVDIKTLSVPASVETALKVISNPSVAHLLNNWEKGIAFEKLQYSITATSSAIGLISVNEPSEINYLRAGMAMERVWLEATKNNLAFQPICLPLVFLNYLDDKRYEEIFSEKISFQIKAVKEQLSFIFSEISKKKDAVFLFRLSEAEKPAAHSLRKPLKAVYF